MGKTCGIGGCTNKQYQPPLGRNQLNNPTQVTPVLPFERQQPYFLHTQRLHHDILCQNRSHSYLRSHHSPTNALHHEPWYRHLIPELWSSHGIGGDEYL